MPFYSPLAVLLYMICTNTNEYGSIPEEKLILTSTLSMKCVNSKVSMKEFIDHDKEIPYKNSGFSTK
jgi:hypothetical protein